MATKIDTAVNAYVTLLKTITQANGYNSNLGNNIINEYNGQVPDNVGKERMPCAFILGTSTENQFMAAKKLECFLTISTIIFLHGDTNLKQQINNVVDDLTVALIQSGDQSLSGAVDRIQDFTIEHAMKKPDGIITIDPTYVFERVYT